MQFQSNNIKFLGVPDSRDESPEMPPVAAALPVPLKQRLSKSAQLSCKSPEQLSRRKSAVQNQREALLEERVMSSKQHFEKVKSVLAKRQEMLQQTMDEVPETD